MELVWFEQWQPSDNHSDIFVGLTCASLAHPHHGSKLCPSCQCEQEDKWHFLECTHPDHAALFRTLYSTLTQLTQKIQLHPCILTALWLGLVTEWTSTPYPDVLDVVLPQVWQPIQLQTWLGWNQVYQGRLSINWAWAINNVHPHMELSGEQVLIMIQKTIWQYVLDMWALCNQHLHHHANQLNLPDYHQAKQLSF